MPDAIKASATLLVTATLIALAHAVLLTATTPHTPASPAPCHHITTTETC